MFHEIARKIENNQRIIRLQDYSIGATRFPMHIQVSLNNGKDSIFSFFPLDLKKSESFKHIQHFLKSLEIMKCRIKVKLANQMKRFQYLT